MTEVVKNSNQEDNLEAVMALHQLGMEELLVKAQEVGVQLDEAIEKEDAIDRIVEAMENNREAQNEQDAAGVCISLRTHWEGDEDKSEAAAALVKAARERILKHQRGGLFTTIYQRNREGSMYTLNLPFTRLTPEKLDQVLNICTPLDEEQEQVIADFRDNPDSFNAPMLVYRRRPDKRAYVMLYLERKVELEEGVF